MGAAKNSLDARIFVVGAKNPGRQGIASAYAAAPISGAKTPDMPSPLQ